MSVSSIKNLCVSLTLALGAAAGCASDPADDAVDDPRGDDRGDGDGDGDGGDGPGPGARLDAAGTYRLQSTLDLAASAPGAAGDVVNTIIDITDDPEDPTLWIVDQALSVMPSGALKTALRHAKPYVVGYLNDRLLELAPGFVGVAVRLADNLGQIAQRFGLDERLAVEGAPGAYAGTLTLVGARFRVDGVERDHAFADHGMTDVTIDPVGVALEGKTRLAIGEHQFALSYGELLRLAVDAAIVPMLEPGASDLHELLAARIDCEAIGEIIEDLIWVGDPEDYEAYCAAGLAAAADLVYAQLAQLSGAALQLARRGGARPIETTGDGAIDTLHGGAWTGTVRYGGTPAPLAGATFFGTRL